MPAPMHVRSMRPAGAMRRKFDRKLALPLFYSAYQVIGSNPDAYNCRSTLTDGKHTDRHQSPAHIRAFMDSNTRVLLVQYSQTGSTERLADSFCTALYEHPAIEVTKVSLQPARPYPFPWSFFSFFDAFPETVQLRSPELEPLDIDTTVDYDLVILSYPVWFLSPAPPVTAFLQSESARRLLANTPTITLIGCRNMWLYAHGTVSRLLADNGAKHCDNVVVTDPGPSLATFITTPRWMLTGRRDRFLGMPPAGLSEAQTADAARFGRALVQAFEHGEVDGNQPLLTGLRAVTVNDALLANERIGHRSFRIWSRLIRLCGEPGAPAGGLCWLSTHCFW